jgi:hypothetical protein
VWCSLKGTTGFFKGRVIALMDAARTSETSVDIQLRTRQYIPEDSEQPGSFFSKLNQARYNCNATARTEARQYFQQIV